jgi:hypothetical protein
MGRQAAARRLKARYPEKTSLISESNIQFMVAQTSLLPKMWKRLKQPVS